MDSILTDLQALGRRARHRYPISLNLGESPSLFAAPNVQPGDELSVLFDFLGDSRSAEVRLQARYELDGSVCYCAASSVSRKSTAAEWEAGVRGVSEGEVLYRGGDLVSAVQAANDGYRRLLADGYSADGGMLAAAGQTDPYGSIDAAQQFSYELAEAQAAAQKELVRWAQSLGMTAP